MKTNTIQQVTISRDINGNKIARVQCVDGTFTIQTLGNMPETHRDGVYTWTSNEINTYVAAYGTARQKRLCDIGNSVKD